MDRAGTELGDCDEVVVNKERNIEPSEVISEFVVITEGDGVVMKSVVVVDDDGDGESVEVREAEKGVDEGVGVNVNVDVGVGVGVDVGIEGVDEADDEIELEEHEDPKRVVNTVTGTLTVNVAGTITVVASPEQSA